MKTALAVILFSILLLPFVTVAHGSGSDRTPRLASDGIKRSAAYPR